MVPLNQLLVNGADCSLNRREHPLKGNDGQWGMAGEDDDDNGVVDDLLEQGMGTDTSVMPIPQVADGKLPFNGATTAQPFRNAARNPYFRYSPISRLSSMTTTRSNVFAIWVTIGFFEVEEAPAYVDTDPRWGGSIDVYNRVYPDGYTFTKEAGIDTGEIQRVREFAIVDRTIPAAFEPGANHNTLETVRLRRKIE
jgi:hypothetical protein